MATPAIIGRPAVYTEEIADEICRLLASGESLNAICKSEHMPARSTVYLWIVNNTNGFSDKHARAREAQQWAFADDIVEMADRDRICEKVTIKADGSEEIVRLDQVDRSRLQVDSRKWLMARLARRTFGEKPAASEQEDTKITVVNGMATDYPEPSDA